MQKSRQNNSDRPSRRRISKRRHYSAEFKLNAVRRTLNSDSVSTSARKLNIPTQTLHNWLKAEKAGKLGLKLSLAVNEVKQLETLCAVRITSLKAAKAIKTNAQLTELETLRAITAKLKRASKLT